MSPYPALRAFGHQHWIRHGVRERIIRRLAHANRSFAVDFFGHHYVGHLRNWIDWNVYFYGAYEPELLALIRDVLLARPGSVFVDVGANVGHHALFASRYATVHAFEPFEPVRNAMIDKLRTNAVRNVHVHPVALGDAAGEFPFYPPTADNAGIGSFVYVRGEAIKLRVVRGDDACASLKRLDMVKIDVEGFEPAVLRGLRATLERFRPVVVFEFSPEVHRAISTMAGLRALFPTGYTFASINRKRPWGLFERQGYALAPLTHLQEASAEILARPQDQAL